VDWDTSHILAVEKLKERLAGSTQAIHKFDMQRFNLRELKDIEGREQYKVKITNRFTAL
jgi:hypothetical protein